MNCLALPSTPELSLSPNKRSPICLKHNLFFPKSKHSHKWFAYWLQFYDFSPSSLVFKDTQWSPKKSLFHCSTNLTISRCIKHSINCSALLQNLQEHCPLRAEVHHLCTGAPRGSKPFHCLGMSIIHLDSCSAPISYSRASSKLLVMTGQALLIMTAKPPQSQLGAIQALLSIPASLPQGAGERWGHRSAGRTKDWRQLLLCPSRVSGAAITLLLIYFPPQEKPGFPLALQPYPRSLARCLLLLGSRRWRGRLEVGPLPLPSVIAASCWHTTPSPTTVKGFLKH